MDESRIKDVGSLLAAFFDEEKLRRGGRYAQFFESWKAVVGERLAAHSRVVDLDKGILIVEAEHPGWVRLLQIRQSQTLEALTARFPDLGLRGIAFRLAGSEYGSKRRPEGNAAPMPDGQAKSESADSPDAGSPDNAAAIPADGSPELWREDPDFVNAISSLKKAIQKGNNK